MMESFENNEFETESNDIPESPVEPLQDTADSSEYRSAGTGRRESPYSNSPYEMNHQSQGSYYGAQTPHHPHKE